MAKQSDAWVFVSHSNRDLAAVRRVRNELESQSANPILFLLKCVEDHDELDALIKREVRARNFFLLCDSVNAQASNWVQQEVALLRSLPNKRIGELTLGDPWHEQQKAIKALLENATVFLSYAKGDQKLGRAQPYAEFLASEDFAVFDPMVDLRPGMPWQQAIERALQEAARGGHLIQFLSATALRSPFVEREFIYFVEAAKAAAGGRHPILIVLDPLEDLPVTRPWSEYVILDAARQPFERTCRRLMEALGIEGDSPRRPD